MLVQLIRGAILVAAVAIGAARAEPIAIVTDVQGRASLQSGATRVPVTILAEIADGARVQLAGGARVTTLYLRSGDEYTAQGPGTVEFKAARPDASGGATLSHRAPAKGREIRIRPAGVAQGGLVLRSLGTSLVSPVASTTLDLRPEFVWGGGRRGVRYRFTLTDAEDAVVHSAEVEERSVRLPERVALKPGALYRWEVSVQADAGHLQGARATFRTATEELRTRAQSLRPDAGAAFSGRVAYTFWLDQMELRDEARRWWRELSAQRPDDAELRERAAN